MRYVLLGNSGLRVSEICLGTMTFGEDWGWGADKAVSRKIFDAYALAGGNFVDTANMYTNGTSEKYAGEFIASERNRWVLATKFTNNNQANGDPNAIGNHRKNMVHSVEASLKRLGTDYIDLLWMHSWDYTTRPEEVMRALDDLVRAGKILYIGVSDTPAWVVSRSNMLAELRGWTQFVALQIEYSLVERTVEREFIPMSRALDLAVCAWSPLANGLLSGKYTKSSETGENRRLDAMEITPKNERNLAIAKEVDAVADKIGRSSAQVAINWLLRKNVLPIIGARTLNHLKDNLAGAEFMLEDGYVDRLDRVSAVELGFPHDFLNGELVNEFAFSGLLDKIHNHRSYRIKNISQDV